VSTSGGPAHYEIRVGGVLDSRWAAWFGGLHIERDDTQTVISGSLADQAALHGLLTKSETSGSALSQSAGWTLINIHRRRAVTARYPDMGRPIRRSGQTWTECQSSVFTSIAR
jgi:hypothetical protein